MSDGIFDPTGKFIASQAPTANGEDVPKLTDAILMQEVGVSGLNRQGGGRTWIYEEWLPQLRDHRHRFKALREMSENHGVTGAVLRAVEMSIKRLAFRIEPPDPGDVDALRDERQIGTGSSMSRDENVASSGQGSAPMQARGGVPGDGPGGGGDPLRKVLALPPPMKMYKAANNSDDYDDMDPEFIAEFAESCLIEDMYVTWSATLSEILTMVIHGWQWSEIVFKPRKGPNDNPLQSSQFNDELKGIAGLMPRSQEWLNGWVYAPREKGGHLVGMRQLAPPYYDEQIIHRARSLHFKPLSRLDSPEGYSLLRNGFRHYWFVKKLEELQGVSLERNLAGLPVAWVPPELLSAKATPQEKQTLQAIDAMLRGVRRDTREGVIFPLAYDADGRELYKFELMQGGGSQTMDIDAAIRRHENRIAGSLLADFIFLGQDGAGSFALSSDKTSLFLQSLDAITESIADEINRVLFPLLCKINNWDPLNAPRLKFESAKKQNLAELGAFLQAMAGSGIMGISGNRALSKHLFQVADLPEPTDEELDQEMQFHDAQQNTQLGLNPDGTPMEEPAPEDPNAAAQAGKAADQNFDPATGKPAVPEDHQIRQARLAAGFSPSDGKTPIIPGQQAQANQAAELQAKLKAKYAAPKPAAAKGSSAGTKGKAKSKSVKPARPSK